MCSQDRIDIKPKKCLYCKKIISGRNDKMFCDDRCRNNFYYKVNSEQKSFIRKINQKLLKNRGILRTLNPSGKTVVTKNELVALGFDFNYYTSLYETKKGKVYYLVYDQAYSMEEQDRVDLIVFYRDAQSVVS